MNNKVLKQYRNALNNMNFEKIEQVMNFLDWGWGKDLSVPSIDEMKDTCDELFMVVLQDHVKEGKRSSASTGGFKVEVWENSVSIEFVLDEASDLEEE